MERRGVFIGLGLMARAAEYWLPKGGKELVVLYNANNKAAESFHASLGGRMIHEGSFTLGGVELAERGMVISSLSALASYAQAG